jgi:RNA polymerase sigma-B factor
MKPPDGATLQPGAVGHGSPAPPALPGSRRGHIPRPAGPAADSTASAQELFGRLADAERGSAVWQALRDELVRRHLPLVHFLVRRFRGRGEPLDDLVQVATIGLIKAVDRFDPERGIEFSTYATPTVVGEVKRHFRDRGWAIKVPRRLQENMLAVTRASAELFGQLSRSPTVPEIAARTQLTDEDVLEAIESSHAYTTVSLDAELDDAAAAAAGPRHATDAQAALECVEDREALRPLLGQLGERERQIILLRFFANMTQSEIAAEVGVSQMHISRLLGRTLARLREGLGSTE